MSLPRTTILPGASLPLAAPSDVSVTALGRITQGDRWRTEAMRSYSCPVLIWVTRGQGRITMAGRRRGYTPNSLIFLPAGTMHGFDRMGAVSGSVVFLPRGGDTQWPDAPLQINLSDSRRQMELTQQIDALDRETSDTSPSRDKALSCLTGLLSVWLERLLTDRTPTTSTKSEDLVAAYAALVERDFASGGTVGDLARGLGVTATHLTRVCRTANGTSAHDLLANRRHFEAKRLLVDTDLPVGDVARQSGFSSLAYFSRTFRQNTGQSPSAFRSARQAH